VDSSGSSGRKVRYEGKEYDYVFDVDIEEGKPPLKLPYNLSENPYEAATKFLGNNGLSITYIDQVAKFILTNTKGATIGQSSEQPPADPYGTESRYKPEQAAQSAAKFLPHTAYLSLTQSKWEPVAKKLRSLNEKHLLAGNKHIAMNPDGLSRLETVLQATMGTSTLAKSEQPPTLLEVQRTVYMILAQWPYSDRLPALDVLRCLVAYPGAASLQDNKYGDFVNIVLRGALDTATPIEHADKPLVEFTTNFDASSVNVNNVMMALRAVTNLFGTAEGRKLVVREANAIVGLLARVAGVQDGQAPVGPDNNNLQIALTSAAFNFTCLAFNERDSVDLEVLMQLCQVAEGVIRRQSDPEVLFRAVMALGMILAIGGEARDVAKTLEVGEPIGEAAKKSGEARIKSLAQECLAYLKR
jgi:phospholipase A-2-activating protein